MKEKLEKEKAELIEETEKIDEIEIDRAINLYFDLRKGGYDNKTIFQIIEYLTQITEDTISNILSEDYKDNHCLSKKLN